MFRMRGYIRGGALTDFVLLCVFIILLYVFMMRRGYMGKVDTIIQARDNDVISIPNVPQKHLQRHIDKANEPTPSKEEQSLMLIDSRLKKITDSRSEECKKQSYGLDSMVSVIVDYNDYQFYDVKTLVSSVILHSPANLLLDIIMVDDGTNLDYVIAESRDFAKRHPKVKLIRNEQKLGSVVSRQRAATEAEAKLLVYLDSNVIVNQGWLEPLVDMIESEKMVIAIPHFDLISDPVSYEYVKTPDHLATTFSWSLTSRMVVTQATSNTDAIKTAVMRGSTFAIRKTYLGHIGGFDETLKDKLSAGMELSFRAWLCGGTIKIAPCSRVGVLNLHDPVRVFEPKDVKRIAELWLGGQKNLVYKSTAVEAASDVDIKTAQSRLKQLAHLNCQNFDWYLQNVARNILTPSARARFYGVLRVRSGRCAHVGADNRIDLGNCKAENFEAHSSKMIFEIDEDGYITTVQGQCLASTSNMYVVAKDCERKNQKHMWNYGADKFLKNKELNLCGMHVTDPDKKFPGRQIMMTQDCLADRSPNKDFVSWEFLPL